MEKISFNDIRKSKEYLKHFEVLISDYSKFRNQYFSQKVKSELKNIFPNAKLFLTHSATGALEMIAQLLGIQPGDEVILPSYTFVSTVNAFVSFGATPVFVDIKPNSKSIDIDQVKEAISSKTKAVIAMHYGGHPADLAGLKDLCEKHQLILIEDAAMGFGNQWKNQPLGTIGDFGVISFDITKQITAIQGGLLLVNATDYFDQASEIFHIGTNREAFMEGEVPYYEWVNVGSKYQMNELNAAVLFDQLQNRAEIFIHRKALTACYFEGLSKLEKQGAFTLMPHKNCQDNVHLFYIQTKSLHERDALSSFLKKRRIESFFHYMPLHTSLFGKKMGRAIGNMEVTNYVAETLLRLPFHDKLSIDDTQVVVQAVKEFYHGRK